MQIAKYNIGCAEQYIKDRLQEHFSYNPNQSNIINFKNTYMPNDGWTFDAVLESRLTIGEHSKVVGIESGLGSLFILNRSGSTGIGWWCRLRRDDFQFTISSRAFADETVLREFNSGSKINATVWFDGEIFKEYMNGILVSTYNKSNWVYPMVYNTISKGVSLVQLGDAGLKYCNVLDLRCYNRTLSEDEIKHNYSIDKKRFDI